MAAPKRKRVVAQTPERPRLKWLELADWRPAVVLGFAVLFFYWIPLTDPQASIQWDAVDTHYSPQKYFADHVREGALPYWTPYIFSGFPFLADVQVGAWYPLNWPFFLAGVTPRGIQLEIVLHAFLACLGAFLLLARLVAARWAALAGALFYAFSGYFADHASHVGMFSAASLAPWMLLCFHAALERCTVRFSTLGGIMGGAILLAGHFQNALYSFAALGLFALAMSIESPAKWRRAVASLGGIVLLAAGLSTIQTLPGLELTKYSIREGADFVRTRDRILKASSFSRVILPIGGGFAPEPARDPALPDDDFYLYGGILLVPLAALGLRNKTLRMPALLLIVLPVWYMLGPDAGLYRLGALLPFFHRVRAPIHLWFVAALGMAMLAAEGAVWIFQRWPSPVARLALVALLFGDLFYWNSFTNMRAYARHSFDELYGNKERLAAQVNLPPVTRYDAPDFLTVFGPLNHPLDLRIETTYGYNPLSLSAYGQYREVMKRNPKLRAGLNVARFLDVQAAAIRPNETVLPRAYFARQILTAKDINESLRLLESLDPAQATIVLGQVAAKPAPDATAEITAGGEQIYHVRYRSTTAAVLKLSVPYFPGWSATVDGIPCPIVRADHALMGIVVPPGERQLVARFHSTYFAAGAITSVAFTLLALLVLLWPAIIAMEFANFKRPSAAV